MNIRRKQGKKIETIKVKMWIQSSQKNEVHSQVDIKIKRKQKYKKVRREKRKIGK